MTQVFRAAGALAVSQQMLRTREFALHPVARPRYNKRMHGFWSFARAPLAWSFAILALYAPFAFIEPVSQPPPPGCDDWLWCNHAYVGLVLDRTPDPQNLQALAIVPGAFVVFLAARVAARGPNRRAHWFMAGPVLALIACPIVLVFWPVHLIFIDVSRSYIPALIVITLHAGLALGILASLPLALLMLIGASAWRLVGNWRSAVGRRSASSSA